MRRVSLVLCAAIIFLGGGAVHAASNGDFRISDWTGRAYWNPEKQFDRCSAQLTNADKITIIYSLDQQFKWSLELSSPTWHFIKGASFPVTLKFGDRGYIRQPAIATEAQIVRVQLPDSLSVFDALRSIIPLELVAGGLTSHFDLAANNQVLTALTRCVVRYGISSRSRAAIAAWLKSSSSPASNINSDASIQNEAAALATNIMAETAIPNAAKLKPNEIPVGINGATVWKADKILLTVSIVPPNEAPEIGAFSSLIIGGDAQKCRGDFFSGAVNEVIGALRAARAFTSCQTPDAIVSVYYLTIPRKQGGLYLLATITNRYDIAIPGEQTARDVDSKIRDSIAIALAKMQQTEQ